MDNVMFYAFKGDGTLNGEPGTALDKQHICRFDTGKGQDAVVRAGPQGLRMMVFTGKQTKEKLIWHGPFVCSSRQQLQQCFHQYQMGNFPPERVDYKNASKIPKK